MVSLPVFPRINHCQSVQLDKTGHIELLCTSGMIYHITWPSCPMQPEVISSEWPAENVIKGYSNDTFGKPGAGSGLLLYGSFTQVLPG